MKRIIRYILLLFIGFCFLPTAYTQHFSVLINFEDTLPSNVELFIDTTSSTKWQIGKPQKTVLDSAYSFPNAIMTDTLQTYTTNDTATFIIRVIDTLECYSINTAFFDLSFRTQLHTDSLQDYGIISYSTDSVNWNPITSNCNNVYLGNIIFNCDSSYLTGNRHEDWMLIRSNESLPEVCGDLTWISDTVYFRFQFISDSIDNSKDGWVIDDIQIGLWSFFLDVELIPQENYFISPNPSSDYIYISSTSNTVPIKSYKVFDTYGRMILSSEYTPNNPVIDIRSLAPGIYFLRIGQDNIFRFIKR